MVGHHANDQIGKEEWVLMYDVLRFSVSFIETMLCRVMNGSGIVGLGGMHLVSHWAAHPNLSIVRPLLECSKVSSYCMTGPVSHHPFPPTPLPFPPITPLPPLSHRSSPLPSLSPPTVLTD